VDHDIVGWMQEQLEQASPDLLRQMVQIFAESLMGVEAEALCNAGYRERSNDRVNWRNGYRPRGWDTRVGSIELAIPKVRWGSYFPEWLLERRRRSEAALVSVVATSYLLGVSTRRMEKLVETLGIAGLSKSQVSRMAKELDEAVAAFRSRPLDAGPYTFCWADAIALKVREGGRVVHVHVLIATGVNADGHREILGLDLTSAEDGAGWLAFWRGLVARGLTGVQLITSDAHPGLVDAIAATLPGASGNDAGPITCVTCSPKCPSPPNGGWPPWCAPSSTNPMRWRFTPSSTESSPPCKPSCLPPPSTWPPPANTCSPSPPSPTRCGGRSGATTRRNG
jgi:transposase-like protein